MSADTPPAVPPVVRDEPSAAARPKARYIYIVSRGHSGSTLLELLLGGHSELLATGELEKISLQLARETYPYPGMCSCGLRPHDCGRWKPAFEKIRRERRIDMVSSPFRFRVSDVGKEEDYGRRAISHWLLNASSRAARYAAYSAAGSSIGLPSLLRFPRRWTENRLFIADALRESTGAYAVIDNSKDPLGMRDLATFGPAQVRIIFLTRDPRASVYSTLKLKKRNRTVEAAARHWERVNSRIVQLLTGVRRDTWMHLRYEDLCRDLPTVCEQLCAFLGLEFEPAMLDLTRADQHTIGGNKIRFKPLGRITEDRAWTQHLSAADIDQIDRISGPLARSLGYHPTVTS
jgi:Sulfotransferase family